MNDIKNSLAPNLSFSQLSPKLQLAWDSTSYDALDKCPRYYELGFIEGYTTTGENPHLTFGTIFHAATELYVKVRHKTNDHEKALIAAMRYAVLATWSFELSRPWLSDEPTKTRNTLLRTIVWYLDTFQDDKLKTLVVANKPAVELSFQFDTELRSVNDEPILLCGHIDQMVEWNESIWILDKKTTKYVLDDSYFTQYNPHNQVSIYSIAGIIAFGKEVDGLIIDGCQVLVEGSRFRRRPIPTSPDSLEEFMRDFEIKFREAEGYAKANYWPMRRSSCGYGRSQCRYRPVCSADPSTRSELLEALYTRRTWDPLLPR